MLNFISGYITKDQHQRIDKINSSTMTSVGFLYSYIHNYISTSKRVLCFSLASHIYPGWEAFLLGWLNYHLFLEMEKCWSYYLFMFSTIHIVNDYWLVARTINLFAWRFLLTVYFYRWQKFCIVDFNYFFISLSPQHLYLLKTNLLSYARKQHLTC